MNASNFHRRIWHPLLERSGIEPPMPKYFVGTRSAFRTSQTQFVLNFAIE